MIIGICMAFDPQRPPLDWKSAVWLPVWLIGMGIISWQGQYSGTVSDKHPLPPTNTFHIGFWWDILVVAAFSVAIYFWAMRTKLPRDEMLLLVNKQGGEEELPPKPPITEFAQKPRTAPPPGGAVLVCGGGYPARSGVKSAPASNGPGPGPR